MSPNSISSSTTSQSRFFKLTRFPKTNLLLALLVIAAAASGLSHLVKDTSIEAFVPDTHPARFANQKVTDLFGLSDAMVIGVMVNDDAPNTNIWDPARLAVVDQLTQALMRVPNIRENRVTSLTTESSIRGEFGAVDVEDYFDPLDVEIALQDGAAYESDAQARWSEMDPHRNTLVANNERGAIIAADLIDASLAPQTYLAVQALVEEHAGAANNAQLHLLLGGPAAVSGYFSHYIDNDARKLLPIGFGGVLLVVFIAFVRIGAITGPLFIILATILSTLGIMAYSGVEYFAITNALPVILIAIAVADAIHVLSAYYANQAQQPDLDTRSLVALSMQQMARPIVLTTLTTMAGFAGLAAVSIMPPIRFFAWFACLGVGLACVFTLWVLPNLLVLMRLKPSSVFTRQPAEQQKTTLTRTQSTLTALALGSARHNKSVVAAFIVITLAALAAASQVHIDRSQVENFASTDALRIADETLNDTFAGTATLEVVVESKHPEGLLDYAAMQAIADLQAHFETLPHVQKTVSIVDYLSLLHRALAETPSATGARTLPTQADAIAQYLLVYEASGDPTDFDEEIDSGYQAALVRGLLNAHRFSETQAAVDGLHQYLDAHQAHHADLGLTFTLAGDVNITYHWMHQLISSHFLGIGLALFLVFIMSTILFKSLRDGLIAVVPVMTTVVALYGVMGILGIHLEPPTSMFAAIAIGVGVDFSIHLIDKLRATQALSAGDVQGAIRTALPSTARACMFNALALTGGFAVLLASELPTLQRFGGFIALAALVSFATTLILVPALLALAARRQTHNLTAPRSGALAGAGSAALVLLVSITVFTPAPAAADPIDSQNIAELDGLAIATKVAARTEGDTIRRFVDMTLTDRRGKSRERTAIVIKQTLADSKQTRVTYTAPKPVRDVTFLSHDASVADAADERWLYLPAAKKVRRIPASDRGDYFLGTDFTYEDMQSELKFDLADYEFERMDNRGKHLQLRGTPVSARVSKELGYGGFVATINPQNWLPVQIEFTDPRGRQLKTIEVVSAAEIDGIWTTQEIKAQNHLTNHQSLFRFRDTAVNTEMDKSWFTANALSRGSLAAKLLPTLAQ